MITSTKYSLDELEKLPTLCIGQADNLKIETESERVWLSRCGIEDGEPYDNKVSIETLINGSWVTSDVYEAI